MTVLPEPPTSWPTSGPEAFPAQLWPARAYTVLAFRAAGTPSRATYQNARGDAPELAVPAAPAPHLPSLVSRAASCHVPERDSRREEPQGKIGGSHASCWPEPSVRIMPLTSCA